MADATHTRCSVCSTFCGNYVPWWNQDPGYSMCSGCLDKYMGNDTPEFINETFGLPGINRPYSGQEMVTHE